MLPESEQPAVARALAKGPEGRWPSCAAFAQQLAEAAAAPPPRPAGRVHLEVTVVNRTGLRLVRAAVTASSGSYLVEPPSVIAAGESRSFSMVPGGALAGAAGCVAYGLEGHGGSCAFEYAVPLLWSNRYASRCPEGYRVEQSGGGGYAARVRFVVTRAGEAGGPSSGA